VDTFDTNFNVNIVLMSYQESHHYNADLFSTQKLDCHGREVSGVHPFYIPTKATSDTTGRYYGFNRRQRWIENLDIGEVYYPGVHIPQVDNYFKSGSYVYDPSRPLGKGICMYVVGVIAGWIHLNLARILPYEYLVFIDCDAACVRFRLVILKKHTVQPARFLLDWRRFIITGCEI
jgi:ribosomal protein L31